MLIDIKVLMLTKVNVTQKEEPPIMWSGLFNLQSDSCGF